MTTHAWMFAAAATVLGTTGASADDAPPTEQLTAPRGALVIDAFLELNLASGAAGKPISLAPDVWYGATDDLTIGLVHSSIGATGFLGGVGDALCLSGSSNGCGSVYPGAGLDVRYRLKAPLAFDGGLYARDFDPFQLALKLGVSGRWRAGKAAIELQPNLFIGLTRREPDAAAPGPTNKEVLNIPVTGSYAVADKLEFAAQLGLALPFEAAGDTFRIPLSVAVRYAASAKLGLGLVFSLPTVIGGSALATGFDDRSLTLGGSYAL